ncbi:peptide transporter family 1-like [Lucilia sericata]|uniref:peptide transporter family 1-like n=1 Tax=Lucilia sericata TaxID=13632 RepID=UPI0018A860E0|nr:peptide transporter family 1-like [Lucilia sericata]
MDYSIGQSRKTYPELPQPGFVQLRIFNGVPGCQYTIHTNNQQIPEITLKGIDYWSNKYIQVEHEKLSVTYTITADKKDCPKFEAGTYIFNETTAYSIFLQSAYPDQNIQIYKEQLEKSSKATPLVRNLANLDKNRKIIWRVSKSGDVESTQPANYRKIIELRATTYEVLVDNVKVHEEKLRHGGVYSLIIGRQANEDIVTKIIEVTEPNSMSILWLIPQYVVMTLGEVMFSVTGLEFSYSQSPVTMKSVLQACWLLTVAFGNVFVVIVAELKFFKSQANEFFLFAGLMFVDMVLFMWMAYRYKPNNPIPGSLPPKELEQPCRSADNTIIVRGNHQQPQVAAADQVQTVHLRQARYTKRQVD